jgi:hypothetical protein
MLGNLGGSYAGTGSDRVVFQISILAAVPEVGLFLYQRLGDNLGPRGYTILVRARIGHNARRPEEV